MKYFVFKIFYEKVAWKKGIEGWGQWIIKTRQKVQSITLRWSTSSNWEKRPNWGEQASYTVKQKQHSAVFVCSVFTCCYLMITQDWLEKMQ